VDGSNFDYSLQTGGLFYPLKLYYIIQQSDWKLMHYLPTF